MEGAGIGKILLPYAKGEERLPMQWEGMIETMRWQWGEHLRIEKEMEKVGLLGIIEAWQRCCAEVVGTGYLGNRRFGIDCQGNGQVMVETMRW